MPNPITPAEARAARGPSAARLLDAANLVVVDNLDAHGRSTVVRAEVASALHRLGEPIEVSQAAWENLTAVFVSAGWLVTHATPYSFTLVEP